MHASHVSHYNYEKTLKVCSALYLVCLSCQLVSRQVENHRDHTLEESQHGESKPVAGQGSDPPPFTGADFLLLCCLQVRLLCITG
jgi:hypothetical protein